MKGVFTLNAKNDKIQTQIDQQTADRTETKKALTTATENKGKKQKQEQNYKRTFIKNVGTKRNHLEKNFLKLKPEKENLNRL